MGGINIKVKLKHVFCIALIILMFKKKKKSSDKHFARQTSEIFLTLFTAGHLLLQILLLQILAQIIINPLNPELNPICYLLALLGAHHFLHVSRIRVKLLTFRLLMSYVYGAPILDVSRSHTTTQHSR